MIYFLENWPAKYTGKNTGHKRELLQSTPGENPFEIDFLLIREESHQSSPSFIKSCGIFVKKFLKIFMQDQCWEWELCNYIVNNPGTGLFFRGSRIELDYSDYSV